VLGDLGGFPITAPEYELRDRKVLGKGHLDVAAVTHHEPRLQAEALDRARFIGHGRGIRRAQRLDQQPVAEHLRRLREPQIVARLGCRHAQVAVGAFQRVRDRHRQQPSGIVLLELSQEAIELLAPETWASGIVHQHPVAPGDGIARSQQAVEHACRPRLAPAIQRLDPLAQIPPVVAREAIVALREHHEYLLDARMLRERQQRVVEQRASRDLQVLLGQGRSQAGAGAGGWNQGVGFGHVEVTVFAEILSATVLHPPHLKNEPPGA